MGNLDETPRTACAVAGAANPLAIAIPCHKVVRRDDATSGYRCGAPHHGTSDLAARARALWGRSGARRVNQSFGAASTRVLLPDR
jgi:O6-methylguanine-DNA--protein-cysteine methyltransferase